MVEILAFSQSSLLSSSRPSPPRQVHLLNCSRVSLAIASSASFSPANPITFSTPRAEQKATTARFVSDSKVPTTLTVDSAGGGIDILPLMSMSQKLTLGYAVLVGVGGLMGYLKGGSKQSLIAGGVSASILYFVYTLLPVNTVLASCIGGVVSATLLGVMVLRFKKTGKVFPAAVVAFMSLVMSGGYLHGILRSLH
ncbi:hypothetical protein CASFOL_016542 [Castilleja foliolosa]|uniref:Uncharacterized protein n=1 Tax=Castilleja foliolosa TaxID=1961234 RepID=A0ABD3DCM9_9LAMI